MNVGIYSNTDSRCGNADYARDLQQELLNWFPNAFVGLDLSTFDTCDVILVSWSPSRVPTSVGWIQARQGEGKKVIVIWQESYDTVAEADPNKWGVREVLEAADAVVAHEQVACDFREIVFIPHGILVTNHRPSVDVPSIGVAGFPFAWKNFDKVASVAKDFGLECKMVLPYHPMLETYPPSHPWHNAGTDIQKIKDELGPLADIREEWMSVEAVIRLLASCTLNMYWFKPDGALYQLLGQSGSVRMAVAAGRPMVISKHRKMKTLLPYEDEFYIAETMDEARSSVQEILSSHSPKKPNRVLRDQGWPTVGKMYRDLIEKVAA